ncbi:hypothetical protein [Haliangium sp. UPWRP_2]|uniref:tetratricopeptide repeat protein n=1 Tax=Haliangium sp. UPWRP_2 TaxID=1931276 RepID=UPI001E653FF5|nr:hypothetical protein [Haliangium sp. UPWRP_2]
MWHFLNPLLSPLPAVTVSTAFKVTPLTSDASLTGVQADDPMEFAARAQRFQSSARIEAKVRVSAGGREKEVTVILVDEKSSKPISFTHYVSPITLAWTNSLSPNARVLFQIIDRQIQRDTGSFLDKVRPDREASRLQEPENEGAEEQPGRLPPAVGTKDAELPAQAEQLFQGGRDSFGKSDYAKAKKQLEKARALCARDHKHAQACAGLLLETSILLGKIYESQNDLPQAMNAFQHVAKYTVNVRGKNEQKAYALAAIARLRPHLGQVIVTQRNKSGCHQEVNWLHPGTTYVRLNGSLQSVSVKAGGITNIGSCQ